MSDEQFKNDPAKLPHNVTGWIELNDELRDSFEFSHGSVWLMAVPICKLRRRAQPSTEWEYELAAGTIDGDGPLRLLVDREPWGWDWSDVEYMAPLRK